METITKESFRRKLHDPIFVQWLTMTYRPSRWVDASWITRLESGFHADLVDRLDMQTWLKEQMHLGVIDWRFFEIPLSRMLFAPVTSINNIVVVLGALCFQLEIKMIIEKKFRQQLFRQLTPEVLRYVEETGPLLLSRQPDLLREIRENIVLWDSQKQTLVDLKRVGQAVFDKALAFNIEQNANIQDLNLWRRYYRLKFPYSQAGNIPSALKNIETKADQSIVTLILKLIRHLEPRCAVLLK